MGDKPGRTGSAPPTRGAFTRPRWPLGRTGLAISPQIRGRVRRCCLRGQVGPSVEKSRLLLDCADGSRRKGVLSPLSPLPRRGQRRGQIFSVQLLNDLPAGQVRHVVLDLSAGPPAGTGTGLYRARELSLVDHPVQGGPADPQQFTDLSRFQQLGCGVNHPFPPKKPQPRGRLTKASRPGATNRHPEYSMPGCSMSGYSTAGYSMIECGSWRSQAWQNPSAVNWSLFLSLGLYIGGW